MEVYEAVHTVLAVREFQSKPVPDSVVRRIIESARLTASSMNGQPFSFFPRLSTPGGHSSHCGLTVPSADQRQAGEISPVNQTGCEPDPIRCPCKLKCDYCRLRELLQQSAISQGVGQRDPLGSVERPERTDTSETEGGSGPNDTTATIVQSSTQRARNISSKSPLTFCPICADSQQFSL